MSYASLSGLIWSVADLLRGDYRAAEYGKVILPFTVLRRLDCVLEKTKKAVLSELAVREADGVNPEPFLLAVSGTRFVNVSPLDLKTLLGDPDHIRTNLEAYIQGFSASVRDIFEKFSFAIQIERLAEAGLLYKVTERFAGFDLSPDSHKNHDMGLAFEDLIRRFSDAVTDSTSGEQFTPRDAIHLMVNLLFIEDDEVLEDGNPVVRTIYDPTAGTGGMLSVAEEYLFEHNRAAKLTMFGQELNNESYAICKADMLIKGQDIRNIALGNTLSNDAHSTRKFDYMLSNPPFGVDWDKVEKSVKQEHKDLGYAGRFGPGLPSSADGAMLFLLHLLSKMRPSSDGGSRIGIVLSGSPLFTGGAGSGPSEIRRYIIENDLLEAIVALPPDMFFNTPLATYVWILSNKKAEGRKGRVQLIDGSSMSEKMSKSLGSKRRKMSAKHIADITNLFGGFIEAEIVTARQKQASESRSGIVRPGERFALYDGETAIRLPVSVIVRNEDFGYRSITVERPLLDDDGRVVLVQKGKLKGRPLPDPKLRDTENVPLNEDIESYLEREVRPHVADAWIDETRTKVGYEIPFARYFHRFEPPRALEDIDAEILASTKLLSEMFSSVLQ